MDIQPIVMALGFKEIIWDMGYIWVILLVMTIAFIFEEIRYIYRQVKPEKQVVTKPKYEILFRKRIPPTNRIE